MVQSLEWLTFCGKAIVAAAEEARVRTPSEVHLCFFFPSHSYVFVLSKIGVFHDIMCLYLILFIAPCLAFLFLVVTHYILEAISSVFVFVFILYICL